MPRLPSSENPVPFVDLAAHHRPLANEFCRKLAGLLTTSDFILGKEVSLFEEEFAAYIGVRYAIGVSNGTDALRMACELIDLRPGEEVLVPANTYIATAFGVTHAGGVPRFVDVLEDSFTIDPSKIEAAITRKTRAIMAVHLFGCPADMDPILDRARRRGLWVIEDAAQAHGALYRGKRVGGIGDIGCFSFYPSKNLGALGDGGMIVTNSSSLAEKARMLRNQGQRARYVHEIIGYNNRLDNVQAAFLRIKLKKLDEHNRMRQEAARHYRRELAGSEVKAPLVPPGRTHVYHIYSVLHPRRDAVREKLSEKGIACGMYYPIPIPFQESYRFLKHRKGDFPVTERLAKESLAIPIYPEIRPAQIHRIARIIRSAVSMRPQHSARSRAAPVTR